MAWLRAYDPDDEYEVVPAIPDDGTAVHNGSGFCKDMDCLCHEDWESITDLNDAIQDGIITKEDADRIYRGQNGEKGGDRS